MVELIFGTGFAIFVGGVGMMLKMSQPENINVLIRNADWAWPQAVTEIFQPRKINALVANSLNEMIRLVSHSRMHLAILDSPARQVSGVQALKILRQLDQLLPCILLASQPGQRLLAEALSLNAYAVLAKPVDLELMAELVDRLFRKYYNLTGH